MTGPRRTSSGTAVGRWDTSTWTKARTLSRRLAAHDLQVERRRPGRTLAASFAYTTVLVSALVVGIGFGSTTVLVLGACAGLAAPWLPRVLTRRIRYGQSSRPRFV